MKTPVLTKTLFSALLLSCSILSIQLSNAAVTSSNPEANKSEVAKDSKESNPPWLGVWIEKTPASLSSHLSNMLKKDQGLIIKKVSPGSPAQKASLLVYDIITQVDDKDIFTEQELVQTIRNKQSGARVKLEIIRQGKLITQDVILETSPVRKVRSAQPHHFMPHADPRHRMGTRPFSSPWMNDPFFQQGFNADFFEQQFNKMQQQFNQLQQQQQRLQQNQQQYLQQQNSWSQFESIQLESTNNGQLHAIVKYHDGKGNNKEFVFSGNHNEIRQQIQMNSEMDDNKKNNLLNALDMNNLPVLPANPQ